MESLKQNRPIVEVVDEEARIYFKLSEQERIKYLEEIEKLASTGHPTYIAIEHALNFIQQNMADICNPNFSVNDLRFSDDVSPRYEAYAAKAFHEEATKVRRWKKVCDVALGIRQCIGLH